MRRSPLSRRTPLRAHPKHKPPSLAEQVWKAPVSGICECGCGRYSPRLHRHHILLAQLVKRADPSRLWDHANSMLLHEFCHSNHHSASRKLPLDVVPDAAVAFAVDLLGEHRAADYFRRRYAPARERQAA